MSAGMGGGASRDEGAGFTCSAATFKLPLYAGLGFGLAGDGSLSEEPVSPKIVTLFFLLRVALTPPLLLPFSFPCIIDLLLSPTTHLAALACPLDADALLSSSIDQSAFQPLGFRVIFVEVIISR